MNLPVFLGNRILYVGLGGGFDVLGALPLHHSHALGVFASVSKDVEQIPGHKHITLTPKSTCRVLTGELDRLAQEHQIDCVVGIDGGIDVLMRGDEEYPGTCLQDFISLAAIADMKSDVLKCLVCVGFGCETDEGLDHGAALENIAALCRDRAFLGSCSLVASTREHRRYTEAVIAVGTKRKSHVQTRIIAATEGQFGNVDLGEDPNLSPLIFDRPLPKLISPLMSIYWFFELNGVARRNVMLDAIRAAPSYSETFAAYHNARKLIEKRKRSSPGEFLTLGKL